GSRMIRTVTLATAAALAMAQPALAQHQHEPEPTQQAEPEHAEPHERHDGMQHGEHGQHDASEHQMQHGEHHRQHEGMEHREEAGHAQEEHQHDGAAADAHAEHAGMSSGLYGPYPMGRDASGTAWQPDVSSHGGVHARHGQWTLMGHLLLNGAYAWSDGPRGDEKAFVAGMIMGSARRNLTNGDVLNFRAMLSPDPLMGASGYPLLFAAGETADGVEPLVDRQHPHDLFMELSASYAHRLGQNASVFVYGGL